MMGHTKKIPTRNERKLGRKTQKESVLKNSTIYGSFGSSYYSSRSNSNS
jgi:hypothetical protein